MGCGESENLSLQESFLEGINEVQTMNGYWNEKAETMSRDELAAH
jgi:hypothetical protein